jgi:hypothetical protein
MLIFTNQNTDDFSLARKKVKRKILSNSEINVQALGLPAESKAVVLLTGTVFDPHVYKLYQ